MTRDDWISAIVMIGFVSALLWCGTIVLLKNSMMNDWVAGSFGDYWPSYGGPKKQAWTTQLFGHLIIPDEWRPFPHGGETP